MVRQIPKITDDGGGVKLHFPRGISHHLHYELLILFKIKHILRFCIRQMIIVYKGYLAKCLKTAKNGERGVRQMLKSLTKGGRGES